jgi:hypothetical protein
MKGSESVVKLLLERVGQAVEESSGLTPLHCAIKGGSMAVLNNLNLLSSLELRLPSGPLLVTSSQGSIQWIS